MYSLDELRQQNKDISDLCEVLTILIEHPDVQNNPYVCELMQRFKEKVWMHLVFEDNTIYSALLQHHHESVSQTAKTFRDSAQDIRHRFTHYLKHWCQTTDNKTEHETLRKESQDIFQQVMARIQYENEYMFPLIEQQD